MQFVIFEGIQKLLIIKLSNRQIEKTCLEKY
jgi:hypothetical protein